MRFSLGIPVVLLVGAPLLAHADTPPASPPTGGTSVPAAEALGGTTASTEGMAVMPVSVRVEDVRAREGSTLLTNVLTAKLDEIGGYRVISADEVAELLKNEAERQQVGCTDEACLAEIAGALGARYVVTGEIAPLGQNLLWSSTLVDQRDGTAVRRASVQGRGMQALLAQVDEVAAALSGKQKTTQMEGAAAQKRLGFSSADDLAAFKQFREQHGELTSTEALTQFLIDTNRESRALAVTEALLFGAAAITVNVAVLFSLGSIIAFTNLRNFPLTLLAGTATLMTLPFAFTFGLAGVALTLVDALNMGHVQVRSDGCCREDAEITDAENENGPQRASALLVLLSGPLSIASIFFTLSIWGTAYALLPRLGIGVTDPGTPYDFTDPGYYPALLAYTWGFMGAFCSAGWPLLVGVPVGLALLFWPSPATVDEVDATEAKATGGAK
ncbi:MAG: hypothetical protein AB2A00_30310 [Myxococcota bacterium]